MEVRRDYYRKSNISESVFLSEFLFISEQVYF